MEYKEVDFTIEPLIPYKDIVVAFLEDYPFDSFIDTDNGLKAYIPSVDYTDDWKEKIDGLKKEAEINYKVNLVEDQNWNAEWESNFQPIEIDDAIVFAPFHEVDKESYKYPLLIQPQMSFGTGHHQTTYLMIKTLKEMNLEGLDVLDMGCGTGVLAILAKKKAASFVQGIDIDEWAFENTKTNLELNNTVDIDLKLGGAEQINHQFDIIIANINKNILKADMETYVKHLNKGGEILFSGFFTTDNEDLIETANKYNLTLKEKFDKEGWSVLVFKN